MSKRSSEELAATDVATEADPERNDDGACAPQPEAAPEAATDEPAQDAGVLAEALEEARSRAEAERETALRLRAEMDNLRKRVDRDLENAHKFALERFVGELLPVKDSMEMGLSAASEPGADLDKLREGTELTLKMLSSAIEKFGVETVDPQGESFDPERHQAMSTVADSGHPPGTVVTVIQKGYLLNGRLVRPALVMVAK